MPILLLIIYLFSCTEELVFEESMEVYGHAYGSPKKETPGMYAPLLQHVEKYAQKKNLIFNGDFIRKNNSEEAVQLFSDIQPFQKRAHFLRANHEFTYNNDSLENLIANRPSHLTFGNASIHLWESYENQWNLTHHQIKLLQQDHTDLIIIISPEVFWWEMIEEEKNAGNIDLSTFSRQYNSDDNRSEHPTFINQVLPILKEKKEVILISGDAGALTYVSPYYFLKKHNITAVNSGMALGEEDNFVEINKLKGGQVKVYLKNLQSNKILEELN